uniref:Uncharacterized protein n=1 Tax=Hyaloperonospora arabidopsidis (strain Emoy2) TaxID=559515 RepID=M4B3P0_HYAAE
MAPSVSGNFPTSQLWLCHNALKMAEPDLLPGVSFMKKGLCCEGSEDFRAEIKIKRVHEQ